MKIIFENTNKFNDKILEIDTSLKKNKKKNSDLIFETYDESVLFSYIFPGIDEVYNDFYDNKNDLTLDILKKYIKENTISIYEFNEKQAKEYSILLTNLIEKLYIKLYKGKKLYEFLNYFKNSLLSEFFDNIENLNSLEELLKNDIFNNNITIYTEEAFEIGKYVFLNPTITFTLK